ncbi:VOC family protein [Bailinhaonella thermotolerans]|uniref:VOC family protein n=1 Tax=Bailinhaonella thermotolerans TaxID=1070861 RepID=A0A3A4B9K6_9ACTN|nr:VOC family protein [Bailinhaonella thermotolerans]RJL34404.1 VOC family protein [Bailinhaonella thermotolerans]
MTKIASLYSVVLDTPEPKALAEFYAAVLDWKITRAEDDWVTITDGGDRRIAFQLAPDHRPPRWPDPEHPQQFHLDLLVDDVDRAEEQVLALGATKAEYQPPDATDFRVYLDPSGHPFCLVWED